MMISKRQIVRVGAIVFVLAMVGFHAGAAELTTANIRLDFIIGGKHAPWFVALEKGFYTKRGLKATILGSTGSADTVRTIGAGGADFGFADIGTMIVAKSRGTPVQAAAQFGYVPATVMWREDTNIKTLKDLEGKSYAISPGQAQWFLMPANMYGSELGKRIFLKTSHAEPRLMRANSNSSGSTSFSPTTVLTTIGKNATRKAMAILENSP